MYYEPREVSMKELLVHASDVRCKTMKTNIDWKDK